MRLYKTVAMSSDLTDRDRRVEWGGTQAEATASRKKFAAEGFTRKEIETHEIEVPTDKAGLLGWLRDNVKE